MSTTISSPLPLTTPTAVKSRRIESIDLLRGVVMIIMALDHTRDYFNRAAYLYDPTDMTQTNAFLFFTRWITHFCAPIFMFLAGTAAFLYGVKKGEKAASFFLLTRGIWLIFVELFIVTVGWTFNVHFTFYILQVIWAFGVAMILLSAIIRLPRTAQLILAIVLIAGHNLLDNIHIAGNGLPAVTWSFLHEFHFFRYSGFSFVIGYPILPWAGLITLGYYLGGLYAPGVAPNRRRTIMTRLGVIFIAGFIVIRAINGYGDPQAWSTGHHPLLSFFNVTKYPPSLDYILMTIGPALLFLAFAERPLNAFTAKIAVYGRVPFFYYLIHIYVLHGLAVIAAMLQGYPASDMTNITAWVTSSPQLKGYGFGLGIVYTVWLVVVISLYPLCRWFDGYKRSHQAQKPWLSYL
ncbi:MAG TPA: heparan-alpha-glucosaminide N-acetyltransferase domain-containing protein [Puia sp.]|nr:heparan-alpha-glucosaminide N-acetyltransferase domain-containing protein [Puia sp.]